MTARTGSVEVKASFPHGVDDTFGILFNDAIFTEQQKADNRLDIAVLEGWAPHAGKPLTFRRMTTYCFGESAVLRQGTSKVSGTEVAVKDEAAQRWTVNVTLDNKGGALASSTKVNAEYKISAAGAGSQVVCTVNFSYDLASVSWMLRGAVEGVVNREMKGSPEKLFKLGEGRSAACAAFVAGLLVENEVSKPEPLTVPAPAPAPVTATPRSPRRVSIRCSLPDAASSDATSGSDSHRTPPQHVAVPLSPQGLSHRSSSRVSSPSHFPSDCRILINDAPSFDMLERPSDSCGTSEESNQMLKPEGASTRLSKRKVRAMVLIATIIGLWWCAAMIGSARR
eukprot:TRINITY_DN2471_c0_g1_i1.p1 TRINITY_DN2471_c0_g1~~TRINITY_DN2471_c0_g1_i1.p1  ORF type:complete len:339 (+),score=89.34 TRINITY_DN2471_c0_g1_i1:73-1089(+)